MHTGFLPFKCRPTCLVNWGVGKPASFGILWDAGTFFSLYLDGITTLDGACLSDSGLGSWKPHLELTRRPRKTGWQLENALCPQDL